MQNYNSYSNFIKEYFGQRVQKLSINVGLNCPNRDGTKGVGGCIYCLNEAFTPSYCTSSKTISQQIIEGIEFHEIRYRKASKFLAYFQSYSNTYTNNHELINILETALKSQNIVGLSIGTRPDCIDTSNIEVLKYFSKKTFLKIELGIESVYDKTLKSINRGHDFDAVLNALELCKKADLRVGGHFILGLPGENRKEILDIAKVISKLDLFSIKLHQLQILKNTKLEELFLNNPADFELFELVEYVNFVVSFAELLNPKIYIERFSAEVPPRFLIAPDWGLIRYDQVLNTIINCFKNRNTYQGKLYNVKI